MWTRVMTLSLVALIAAGAAVVSAQGTGSNNAVAACTQMMAGSDTGTQKMREFMQSDKGRQAMTNMMEMAKRMGNGDPAAGMTRMMEMMGGGTGMMGRQGGGSSVTPSK